MREDPGPLERWMCPLAVLCLCRRCWMDKGSCPDRQRLCSFSWSDDSFQFTKDSGQGDEKSGWLIRPYDFTLQRTSRRGVTLQIPEALQWDVAQFCDAWRRREQQPSCSMQIGQKNAKEDLFSPLFL